MPPPPRPYGPMQPEAVAAASRLAPPGGINYKPSEGLADLLETATQGIGAPRSAISDYLAANAGSLTSRDQKPSPLDAIPIFGPALQATHNLREKTVDALNFSGEKYGPGGRGSAEFLTGALENTPFGAATALDDARTAAGQGHYGEAGITAAMAGLPIPGPGKKVFSEGIAAARKLRGTTDSGFYSPALAAVRGAKQEKFTPEQAVKLLTGPNSGVKREELQFTGFDEWIEGKRKEGKQVTKPEMEDFLEKNAVQITEKRLADPSMEEVYGALGEGLNEAGLAMLNTMPEERLRAMYDQTGPTRAKPKYSGHTLPGGTNYREVVMKWAEKGRESIKPHRLPLSPEEVEISDLIEGYIPSPGEPEFGEEYARDLAQHYPNVDPEWIRGAIFQDLGIEHGARFVDTAHFQQANPIVHIRMKDRTGPNGEKILSVEEIQSDWGKEARDTKESLKKQGIEIPGWKGTKDPQMLELADNQITEIKENPVYKNWKKETADLERLLAETDKRKLRARGADFQNAVMETKALQREVEELYDNPPPEIKKLRELQKVRKQLENAPAHGPYITDSNKYVDLALKKVLIDAEKGGYDKIAIVPGSVHKNRYQGMENGEGLEAFYDKLVVNNLRKMAKKMDPDAPITVESFGVRDPNAQSGASYELLRRELGLEVEDNLSEFVRDMGEEEFDDAMDLIDVNLIPALAHVRQGGDLSAIKGNTRGQHFKLTPKVLDEIMKGLSIMSVGGGVVALGNDQAEASMAPPDWDTSRRLTDKDWNNEENIKSRKWLEEHPFEPKQWPPPQPQERGIFEEGPRFNKGDRETPALKKGNKLKKGDRLK